MLCREMMKRKRRERRRGRGRQRSEDETRILKRIQGHVFQTISHNHAIILFDQLFIL